MNPYTGHYSVEWVSSQLNIWKEIPGCTQSLQPSRFCIILVMRAGEKRMGANWSWFSIIPLSRNDGIFFKDSLSTSPHYAKEWAAQLANVPLNRTFHLMRPDKKQDSPMFKQSLQGHPGISLSGQIAVSVAWVLMHILPYLLDVHYLKIDYSRTLSHISRGHLVRTVGLMWM